MLAVKLPRVEGARNELLMNSQRATDGITVSSLGARSGALTETANTRRQVGEEGALPDVPGVTLRASAAGESRDVYRDLGVSRGGAGRATLGGC